MTNSFTSDDLMALAKFPFKDPRWQTKFLIGSLLILAGYFIPIIPGIFLYGYAFQIMRRIIVEKGEPYLPEWDDWGKFFTDGGKLIGAVFIYSLPLLVLMCGGYGLFFALNLGTAAISSDPEAASPAMVVLPLAGAGIMLISLTIGMILALLLGMLLPVAIGHLVATNDFAAAFRVREWWPIFKANWSGYLISYALLLGFWMVFSFAIQLLVFTVILCCLVPFIMIFITMYLTVIGSVLFGQAYRAGVEQLASPLSTSNAPLTS
jgi:hypothetical protein